MAGMNMQALMRQAQKMQSDMEKAQAELANTMVEGVAGGGMVKVEATATGTIKGINIDPEVVDPEDVEMLQDLILAAINDAAAKAQAVSSSRMGAVTGGLKLPF